MHRRRTEECDHQADGNDFWQERQGLLLHLRGRLDDRNTGSDERGKAQHRQRNDCGRHERIVQQSVKRVHYLHGTAQPLPHGYGDVIACAASLDR